MSFYSGKNENSKKTRIDYTGPLDPWTQLIIKKKYETLQRLQTYDIEDYLMLFEWVLVESANEMLAQSQLDLKQR